MGVKILHHHHHHHHHVEFALVTCAERIRNTGYREKIRIYYPSCLTKTAVQCELTGGNETIIREAELDILTLGDDLFRIYNEFGLSSKKRKRDINIYEYNPSVSITWKKNIINFFSRAATIINKNLLGKPIQFLVKYKKYRYTYYTYIKYLTSYFGLRTRELKKRKIKEILKTVYQYRDNIGYLKIYHDHYKIW